MEKLKELMSLCKCSVSLTVNDHKDYYQTTEESLKEDEDLLIYTDPEVIAEMIKRDTIITLSVYPNTPVSSYSFYHYDLEAIVEQAIQAIKAS